MNDYQSKKEAEKKIEDSPLTERQNKDNSKDTVVDKFSSLQKMTNLPLGKSLSDNISLFERVTKLAQGRTIADSISLSERVAKIAQGNTIADSVALSEKVIKLAQGNSIADSVALSEKVIKLAQGNSIADSVALSERVIKLAQGSSITEWERLTKSIKKTNNSKISEKLLIPAISGLIVAQAFNPILPNINISSPLINHITNIQRAIGNVELHSFIKEEDYDYVNSFLSTIQSEVETKETASKLSLSPNDISTQPGTHSPDVEGSPQHQLSNAQLYDKLIEIFNLLPSRLRQGIVIFVTCVLLPAISTHYQEKVLVGINALESYAYSLLTGKPITKHEIVNSNKDVEWDSLSKFRFITGDNVRLRTSPSMNSEVIESIGKNTIVAIVESKDRQWLLVQVKSGDEIITGWITRTYTKPLKG